MFNLRLLGTVQVEHNRAPVQGFESRKALALLCYVALRAQPLSRRHLADLFWGDKSEARGRGNLSRVLHNLNDLLPDTLDISRDTIQLKSDSFALDTREFEESTTRATPKALTAATALYHDEFMAGTFLDDCPEFEVWLLGERERWRRRVVSVLECLSGYYARRGEFANALPFAARLLEFEPWREEAHRQMMQLLARTGQRSAALQQYETVRRVLGEEFRVEPSSETKSLYTQILSEEIAPPVTPRHNLPTQLTSFFGRETELTRIDARLNNPDCRLLTLVGTGGIGKTRLATEAARNLPGSFHDGVYFVPLASVGAGQIELVIPAIANALGFPLAGPQEPKTQLHNFLRAKQLLLVLDNFEHLLDGTPLILEILQHAPNVKFLVTSREPLNVQAEWITRVQGLSYPTSAVASEAELMRYSAVRLFAERAKRVRDNFELNSSTSPSVIQICRIVEGMPLAIELAAAAVSALSIAKIAEETGSNLDLATPNQDVELRHHSLRAVLDWSYGLLSEPEQALFRRLSAFPGGWTLEAANAVCAGGVIEDHQVFALLTKLCLKPLVLKEDQNGTPRYRMLEPVRKYAQEKLEASVEAKHTLDLQMHFFLELEKRLVPTLVAFSDTQWITQIEQEYANLRAAIDWAAASKQTEFEMKLLWATFYFWTLRGDYNEGLERFNRSLSRPESRVPSLTGLRAQILEAAGLFYWASGKFDPAGSVLEESLTISRLGNYSANLFWALFFLGQLETSRANYERAQLLYLESLQVAFETGDKFIEANSYLVLGQEFMRQGNLQEARAYFEKSVFLFRELNDISMIYRPLNGLSFVCMQESEFDKAILLSKEALHVERYGKHPHSIAQTLTVLGTMVSAKGQVAELALRNEYFKHAARLLGAAQTILEYLGVPYLENIQLIYEQTMATLHAKLDETTFEGVWKEGRVMTVEQAIAYALEN